MSQQKKCTHDARIRQRISSKRAEEFLFELLNLQEEVLTGPLNLQEEFAGPGQDGARFMLRFANMLPTWPREIPDEPGLTPEKLAWRRLCHWRSQLRVAWIQEPAFGREAWVAALISKYNWDLQEPDSFREILIRALHIASKMRRCPNGECPAPYFIAKRRTQKYCSAICAAPAHQATKNKWWKEHGEKWLAARKAKQARRKSQRKRGE